jgi:hypothetical protein
VEQCVKIQSNKRKTLWSWKRFLHLIYGNTKKTNLI